MAEGRKLEDDMWEGEGLKMIVKNRAKTRGGELVRGGGVAIVYDPEKIHLKQLPIRKSNHEVVAAMGKFVGVKRKAVLYCAYMPPNMNRPSISAMLKGLSESIHKVKKSMDDPYIICLLYTSPSPRDRQKSRMPSSA